MKKDQKYFEINRRYKGGENETFLSTITFDDLGTAAKEYENARTLGTTIYIDLICVKRTIVKSYGVEQGEQK